MNSITEKFWYTSEDSKNMRLIVSTLSDHPSAWTVTKCENVQPFGIQKLTIYSGFFNEHTDYVNLETGEMYANYFDHSVEPIDDPDNIVHTPSQYTDVDAHIYTSSSSIKISGSYRTISAKIFDMDHNDITEKFQNDKFYWDFQVGDNQYTDVIKKEISFNEMKIKLPSDYEILGDILTISCKIFDEHIGYIYCKQLQLDVTE